MSLMPTAGQQLNGRKPGAFGSSLTSLAGKGPFVNTLPLSSLFLAYSYSGSFREGLACFQGKARDSGNLAQYVIHSSVASRV